MQTYRCTSISEHIKLTGDKSLYSFFLLLTPCIRAKKKTQNPFFIQQWRTPSPSFGEFNVYVSHVGRHDLWLIECISESGGTGL